MAPQHLMDELFEEILFRLPASDPASLVRAAVACKNWYRLVSDPGFRRRFRKFNRTPPMLGFIYRYERVNHFVPTSRFGPPCAKPEALGRWNWYPIDARHGLFLFFDVLLFVPGKMTFIVFNAITGDEWRLPMPKFKYEDWSAAVLFGTAGCDHLDCPSGAFVVVFVGTRRTREFTSAWVYSSQAGTWSTAASVRHPADGVIRGRSALLGNALYFVCWSSNRILEYDLRRQELVVISLPSTCKARDVSVMTAEDGGLGFAIVQKCELRIWSREEAAREGWERRMVIQLESSVPDNYFSGIPGVIFIEAPVSCTWVLFQFNIICRGLSPPVSSKKKIIEALYEGAFAINKSGFVKCIAQIGRKGYYGVLPYMSFILQY